MSVHEKETPKRMSLAHLQHPASLQSLHQLHQIHPHPHLMAAHQQQMMWHARSFESGIGIYRRPSRYDLDNQTPPHAHHHPTLYPSVVPYNPCSPFCSDYQPQSLPLDRVQSIRQSEGEAGRPKVRRKKSLRQWEEWRDDSSSNAGEEGRAFYIPKPKIISTNSNPALVVADPFGSVPVVSHGYWMATPAAVAFPQPRKWTSENDLFPTLKRQHTFRGAPTPKRILAEEEASQKCEADFSTGEEDFSVDSIEKTIYRKIADPVKYVTKIYLARQNLPGRKGSMLLNEPVLRKSMSSDSFFLRAQDPMGDPDNTPDGSHEEPNKVKVKRCPAPSRLPVRRYSLQQRPGSADGGSRSPPQKILATSSPPSSTE